MVNRPVASSNSTIVKLHGIAKPLYCRASVALPVFFLWHVLVCCVAGTTLDFGPAGVGVIPLWRLLRCTKTHALLSAGLVMSEKTDATEVDSQPNAWDFPQIRIFFLAY